MTETNKKPNIFTLFYIFFKIGLLTFGGGYVMLAIIYDELCYKTHYCSEEEMDRIIAVSQSLPGVMSVNTAAQVGFRFHSYLGAVVAALGCMLPSFVIIVLLAGPVMRYRQEPVVAQVFFFIRCTVVGLLISAALKMGRGIEKNKIQIFILILTLILVLGVHINPFILIIAAGLFGKIYASRSGDEA